MHYNFDDVIDRSHTDCLKYDFATERGVPADTLSMWVADMDFRTAPPVVKALEKAVRFGIYGYTDTKADYVAIVGDWYADHFGWQPQPEWLVKTPGVVYALGVGVQAFTAPGDNVLIQQPVYYPFSEVIRDNGRQIVSNTLVLEDGHYHIDFDDFEKKAADPKTKLFLLCSPHNPVGRVWTADELTRMADICIQNDVIIMSDEIHSDFVWGNRQHHVLAGLSDEVAGYCVICTAPSKAFNLAGLQISNIFIPNADLRERFKAAIAATGYSQVGEMGIVACKAAYTQGEDWLNAVKTYIDDNIRYFDDYLKENLPQLKLIYPEGTYLLWVDCRELGMTPKALDDFIKNDAKLWLDSGAIFGKAGAGFERFNVACPRKTVTQALEQFNAAVKAL